MKIAIFTFAALLLAGCGHNAVTYGDGVSAEIGLIPDQYKVALTFRYGKIFSAVVKEKTKLTLTTDADNNGTADWHTAPYTCVAPAGLQTDWEGFLLALREIGYRGDLNFETFRVLRHLPKPLHEKMLSYIAEVGRYFRDQILAEE